MRNVRPALKIPTVTIAEEQEEYKTIVAGLLDATNLPHDPPDAKHNIVVLAFRLSPAEREQIFFHDADVYISLLTFGQPMQPIKVYAGKRAIAAEFGLEVE